MCWAKYPPLNYLTGLLGAWDHLPVVIIRPLQDKLVNGLELCEPGDDLFGDPLSRQRVIVPDAQAEPIVTGLELGQLFQENVL